MAPDDIRSRLAAECDVLTRYLTGALPSRDVTAAYLDGVSREPGPPDDADARLLDFAGRGPVRARTADVWCRVFAPTSRLRRRLVLLLAILECTPAVERLDRIATTAPARVAVGLARRAAASAALLLVGTVLLAPVLRLRSGRAPEA